MKLRSSAQKELDALSSKEYEATAKAISLLAENRRPSKVKKLADSGLWRVRVRDCRIVYSIDDNAEEVIVVRVAWRSEGTYKGL
jgi:mRNA-degrading endonuclease RelE of RelBE toxin-antitoxin system